MMLDSLISLLAAFNQILTAGIVILAFSLLLYALTFNLRDRVARSFALLLAFVSAVYFGDVVASLAATFAQAELWLRLQWVGIAFVPAGYVHFSDALLATTGQPSRGRRRSTVRVLYVISAVTLVLAAFSDAVVRPGRIEAAAPHLAPGPGFWVFAAYFAAAGVFTGFNFLRAYRRCLTSTTRRRMGYLMISAFAPAIGSFPYLLLTREAPTLHPLTFWGVVLVSNLAVAILLVVMAYTVAYFGVAQPDRVVKARVFQWLLRGPFPAWVVLATWVSVGRISRHLSLDGAQATPFFVIGILLLLQFAITLTRIPLERWLFYGADRGDVRRLQVLQERLLTTGDLREFLESVVAAACDLLRAPSAFLAAVGPGGIQVEASVGGAAAPRLSSLPFSANGSHEPLSPAQGGLFIWHGYWVTALHTRDGGEVLGLLGLHARAEAPNLTPEESDTLRLLAERAAGALEDRRLQREVFSALDRLMPQIESVQLLRAAARYGGSGALTQSEQPSGSGADFAQWVRDALTHYWGGPKLTGSPLLSLRVVEQALREHDGNTANALRAVLRDAIERIRPEGQRKFTGEWILYNILEMKFLQGRRVRDVALRLAISEADLYRKQRVAIEEVARAIADMEQEARERASGYEAAG